ncbi:MAG: radical SAM protein [Elusimicrobia bacterium]|nr:radical SAM protein [Elusimicrobiota bacterium]
MNRSAMLKWAFRLARRRAGAFTGLSGRFPPPKRVVFEISDRCNLRCSHCGFWRLPPEPSSPSTSDWVSLLRPLNAWLGPFSLSFKRGEPLLEPSLDPIIREASSLGIATSVTTNAMLLDAERAGRLAAAGLSTIRLSLDSLSRDVHDSGRGRRGCYDKVMRALELLAGLPMSVSIISVITSRNLRELAALTGFVSSRKLASVVFNPLQRAQGADLEGLWPGSEAGAALDELIAMKKAGAPVENSVSHLELMKDYFSGRLASRQFPACAAGRQFTVLKNGDIQLCPHMQAIGNIKRISARSAWGSPAGSAVLGAIAGCRKDCRAYSCNFDAGAYEGLRLFAKKFLAPAVWGRQ